MQLGIEWSADGMADRLAGFELLRAQGDRPDRVGRRFRADRLDILK